MPKLDRREILQAGVALAAPLSVVPAMTSNSQNKFQQSKTKPEEKKMDKAKDRKPKLQFLEIVTEEVDALCKQYSTIHGTKFGKPEPSLGNARVAELAGGSKISIRGPLREGEAPVIRPYMQVEDIEKAVGEAEKAGAKVAIPKMEIPGHGTIAIVIQGKIECGFWQT